MTQFLSEINKKRLLELYRAHFNATEASNQLNLPYQKVVAIYKGFRVANIVKYDRSTLIQELDYNINSPKLSS